MSLSSIHLASRRPSSRSTVLALLAVLTVFWPQIGWAEEEETEVHQLKEEFFPGNATLFDTDLSFGDLVIEGADQRNISVELRLFCRRDNLEACERAARKVYVTSRTSRDRIELELERTPRARIKGIRAEMRVRVPHLMLVEVDVRAGSVEVSGMRASIEVDSAASNVEITHERSLVGQVKVDVGIGEAHLWVDGSEIKGSGFPRSLRWAGQGSQHIEVDMGSGNVDVTLR